MSYANNKVQFRVKKNQRLPTKVVLSTEFIGY